LYKHILFFGDFNEKTLDQKNQLFGADISSVLDLSAKVKHLADQSS